MIGIQFTSINHPTGRLINAMRKGCFRSWVLSCPLIFCMYLFAPCVSIDDCRLHRYTHRFPHPCDFFPLAETLKRPDSRAAQLVRLGATALYESMIKSLATKVPKTGHQFESFFNTGTIGVVVFGTWKLAESVFLKHLDMKTTGFNISNSLPIFLQILEGQL